MNHADVKRASTHEEVKPLIDLCKAGRLFDVQSWIAAGNPVNPPPHPGKGARKKAPLEYAIDAGFHSLVEVLLKGGADFRTEGSYCPMNQALEKGRFDIVRLLVEHGYDPKAVDMGEVFASWQPEIMEYFIDRGADVESNMPLAEALCNRIRTALRIFKKYADRFPSFQEQINVALRHHCKEGNMKWISLLLWAGADPLAPGESEPNATPDPEGGLSALGFAALYNHYDVFAMKRIQLLPDHPAMRDILRYSCDGRGTEIVERLLATGMNPNDRENGGCSAIQDLLSRLEWGGSSHVFSWELKPSGIDTERTRDYLKVIHLLVKHGGRWAPEGSSEINSARRSLLKMTPDYTVEFVWIMAKYQACSKEHVEALLRTPTIKRHTSKHRQRLAELVKAWEVPDVAEDEAMPAPSRVDPGNRSYASQP